MNLKPMSKDFFLNDVRRLIKLYVGEENVSKFNLDDIGSKYKEVINEITDFIKEYNLPSISHRHDIPWKIRYAGITDDMPYDQKREEIERENNKKWTKEQYEKMGINVIGDCNHTYFKVELPQGWRINKLDNNDWYSVLDEKGRMRIYFYEIPLSKDQYTSSSFKTRYNYEVMPFDHYKSDATVEERNSKKSHGYVYDCGDVIFRTDAYYCTDLLAKKCREHLDTNYPNWQDFNAYWND